MHDGVDIAAPLGTAVHAADSGTVVFVGKLNGYGNTVIIRHSDNYVTVYGHNSRVLVSEGTSVARGQNIAEVGTSGRTTGPNLHFEVRYDNHAYNPLSLSCAAGSVALRKLCPQRPLLVSLSRTLRGAMRGAHKQQMMELNELRALVRDIPGLSQAGDSVPRHHSANRPRARPSPRWST